MRAALLTRRSATRYRSVVASIANDTFTDVAGTNLTAHTADSGQAWAKNTEVGNGVISASGRARGGTAKTRYDLNITPATAEVDIELDVTVISLAAAAGIIARSVGNTTRVNFFYSSSGQTWNVEDGGGSIVATSAVVPMTVGTPYHIRIECRNATKKIFSNGVQVLSTTSNLITPNGKVGFQWSADGSASDARGIHFDNLMVYPV